MTPKTDGNIAEIVERAEDLTHDLARGLHKGSHAAEEAITEALDKLAIAAQTLAHNLRSSGVKARKDVLRRMEEHPLSTAGLAAAALALVGMMIADRVTNESDR